jgi:hypothetical protein
MKSFIKDVNKFSADLQRLDQDSASSPYSSDSGESSLVEIGDDKATEIKHPDHQREMRYKWKRFDWKGKMIDESSDEEHIVELRKSRCGNQKYAFTWKERSNPYGKVTSIEVEIHCQALRKVLAAELGHVPFIHWSQPRLRFANPFPEFVANWSRLRSAAAIESQQGGCGTHLTKLLDRISETKQVKRYFTQEHNKDREWAVRFLDLELYFRPGEELFARVGDQPRAFLLFDAKFLNEDSSQVGFRLFAWKYGMLYISQITKRV